MRHLKFGFLFSLLIFAPKFLIGQKFISNYQESIGKSPEEKFKDNPRVLIIDYDTYEIELPNGEKIQGKHTLISEEYKNGFKTKAYKTEKDFVIGINEDNILVNLFKTDGIAYVFFLELPANEKKEAIDQIEEGINSPDFRNVKWGMSKNDVKNSEEIKLIEERDSQVIYQVKLAGKDVVLIYDFLDFGLYRASYIFNEKHSNKNDYIEDYKETKSLITKKYGEPKIDRTVWRNDLYKSNSKDYGMAVSVGHLQYICSWNTEETEIQLGLIGENFEINMGLNYYSNKFKNAASEVEEKKKLKDF